MRSATTLLSILLIGLCACTSPPSADKQIPQFLLKFGAGSFRTPIGEGQYATESNDFRDSWYNAQDFGENRHLGEDWNANTGGDTDCGEPVYATADGVVVYSRDSGPGWGNVVMVEHTAPDGTKLRSLYGHLDKIDAAAGFVRRGQKIGTIGNAGGRYKCHLHFELRWSDCPLWNDVGPGYSDSRHGWIDPTEFIKQTH